MQNVNNLINQLTNNGILKDLPLDLEGRLYLKVKCGLPVVESNVPLDAEVGSKLVVNPRKYYLLAIGMEHLPLRVYAKDLGIVSRTGDNIINLLPNPQADYFTQEVINKGKLRRQAYNYLRTQAKPNLASINKNIVDSMLSVYNRVNSHLVTLYSVEFDCIIYKVSNNVNPFSLISLLYREFNKFDYGIYNPFDCFSIGNSYKELLYNYGAFKYGDSKSFIWNNIKHLINAHSDYKFRHIVRDTMKLINN